ncbi:site-specific integrase [Serratia sp. UGAL515B_01]|uniref:tyrosine-type recombinase/integrase n=1 Tax=Serratia sp. UGAL515B_01 TaxID=2986763 RepID=UPI002954DD4E|nr:site-specific integrase [Serratia sp. UGAL515B_01]WON77850.1 site-specific integrase [Serratia sp. UGAL515B_01]
MAYYSIEKRQRADGTTRYRCTVGVKQGGKYIYRESKTFGRHQLAKTWGANRVTQIETDGVPGSTDKSNNITVGDLLNKYINDPALGGKVGRTKGYVLNMLMDCDIAKIKLLDLQDHHIIEHCRDRAAAGAGPATVSQDLSYLSAVLSSAKPIYGIDYTRNPAKDARPSALSMGLIGKSQRRSRRPASEELELIFAALRERSASRYSTIPYEDILNFSILSCMRISEVCRIRWDDVDKEQRAVLVRDRKDPRKKVGNHMMVPLLGEAWEIVQRQPKNNELVFPYNSKSVGSGFSRVRDRLGIKDLRYHDMRREAASRLFEAGFSIEEVAQVTGHRNLNILWQVYTELYPKSLHEKFDALQKSKLNAE